ncbi:hypothetical protein [Capillimicrobium parvum]|uniref:hypothetical protein n=1 Tax=Capillimicrobium parvum TaxID=2884022 RepID=UPI00216B5EDB|nr:hypothetical protein [Capillimicrobium parvum]
MTRLRRLLLPAALLLTCVPAAAAHAQAQAPAGGGSSTTNCPSFQVLNNDRIGNLQLPAGAYDITVNTPSTLTCAAASDLFRQFLEDFDGRLGGGWQITISTATFSRSTPRQSFSVARTGAQPSNGGSPIQPDIGGGTCPATFQVLHEDHIGDLAVPAGNYRLNLLSAERMTCDQAASSLASFLQDYNGRLPRPWFVDAETGTFLNGSINVGFWIEPVSGTPFRTVLKLPGDGTPCAGTFQVLHNDKIGALNVPKGHYLFVPLAQSNLSCKQVVTLLRRFLAAPQNQLPGQWVVARKSGTFTDGRGSKVGFRIKPAQT